MSLNIQFSTSLYNFLQPKEYLLGSRYSQLRIQKSARYISFRKLFVLYNLNEIPLQKISPVIYQQMYIYIYMEFQVVLHILSRFCSNDSGKKILILTNFCLIPQEQFIILDNLNEIHLEVNRCNIFLIEKKYIGNCIGPRTSSRPPIF